MPNYDHPDCMMPDIPYEDIPPHTDADAPYSAVEIENRFWELIMLL